MLTGLNSHFISFLSCSSLPRYSDPSDLRAVFTLLCHAQDVAAPDLGRQVWRCV